MPLTQIHTFYFRLPFARPMKVGSRLVSHREGYLVRLTDESGNTGYGEVSPLPGLDDVTLADCRKDLREYVQGLKTGGTMVLKNNPVVNFGIESAVLALQAKHPGRHSEVGVNGLFVPDPDRGVEKEQADRLIQGGYTTVKAKIGRLPLKAEAASIRRLCERSGGGIVLRLDANRSLSFNAYVQYFNALGDLPVEYVEEPLKDGDFEKAGSVGWPLAVDESLTLYWDGKNHRLSGLPEAVTHVVIKPSTPAGFSQVMRHFSEATDLRVLPVVSAAFNTVYGMCALALFINRLPAAINIAHGLDTGTFLKSDLACDSLWIENGRLTARVEILWDKSSPDFSQLQEIDP